jgi:hypothetical protein
MNGMAAPASSGGLQQQQQQAAPPPASSLGLSFVSAEANSGGSKAARKKAAKGALPTWQCALCTFNNKITREACEMCEMVSQRSSLLGTPVEPLPSVLALRIFSFNLTDVLVVARMRMLLLRSRTRVQMTRPRPSRPLPPSSLTDCRHRLVSSAR